MEKPSVSARVSYFDCLRALATFLVVMLHTAAKYWHTESVTGLAWNTMNIYDSISRCGVPLFLMISGALFLSKEISLKKLYTKNILRVGIAYCVWSVFYAVVLPAVSFLFHQEADLSLKTVVKASVTGHYHLWFIPMIIGIYLCVPILKKIVEDQKIALYYLALSFFFSFLFPEIVNIAYDLIGGHFAGLISMINTVYKDMHLSVIGGYSFYFVAGYVLSTTELPPKHRRILYILGILGVLLTVALSLANSLKAGAPKSNYYGNITFNVALYAAAVFVWFKYHVKKTNVLVDLLSGHSFGIYLFHVFVLEVLNMAGLNSLSFFPPLSIPVIALLILILSFGVVYLIRKIPVIGKIIT